MDALRSPWTGRLVGRCPAACAHVRAFTCLTCLCDCGRQVSFIFYAKRWPEGQFDYLRDRVTKGFGRNASNWGYSNILGRPWSEVVLDGSKYFHDGVMSVFAEVQILDLQMQDKGDRSPSAVGALM